MDDREIMPSTRMGQVLASIRQAIKNDAAIRLGEVEELRRVGFNVDEHMRGIAALIYAVHCIELAIKAIESKTCPYEVEIIDEIRRVAG